MPNDKKPGTVVQRAWWRIRDLYHQLKPCRFSLIVALIAWPVFVWVTQGTEILRTVGEGTAIGGKWEWFRIFVFFLALMLWATASWYAARILLYFDFPEQRGVARSKFAETQVPRILGVMPILIIGWGFVVASRSYGRRLRIAGRSTSMLFRAQPSLAMISRPAVASLVKQRVQINSLARCTGRQPSLAR